MELSQPTIIFLQNIGFVQKVTEPSSRKLLNLLLWFTWNSLLDVVSGNSQMCLDRKHMVGISTTEYTDDLVFKTWSPYWKTDCIIAFLTLAKLTVQDYKIFLKHTTSQKESISSVVTLPMQLHRNWMKFPGATFIWGSVHSRYMCCLVKLCFFILTGSWERPGLLLPCGRGKRRNREKFGKLIVRCRDPKIWLRLYMIGADPILVMLKRNFQLFSI